MAFSPQFEQNKNEISDWYVGFAASTPESSLIPPSRMHVGKAHKSPIPCHRAGTYSSVFYTTN